MDNTISGYFLGVLGGMGPAATASFSARLAALTPADVDQEHIPNVVCNDPRIPDRSTARLGQGPDPLPHMLRGIAMLNRAGVQCIAIPCNTAHFWYDALVAASDAPVLHIIECVIDDLKRQGIHRGRIGVLGTAGTLREGIYQDYLHRAGYDTVAPESDADIEQYCSMPIRAVKGNRVADAFAPVAAGIDALKARGAIAVVMGCTELPLAAPMARRDELSLPVSDSIDALALAVIARYQAAASTQGAGHR